MKYIVISLLVFLAPTIVSAKTITNAEWHVKDYFRDSPDLVKIAYCESTYRQFDKNGDVLQGRVNSDDIGIMQINRYYHGKTAIKLGYDIYSMEGNLGYAKWLYEHYGDRPWVHSKKCWA